MVLKIWRRPATLMPLLFVALLSVSAIHAEKACSQNAKNACISEARTAFGSAFDKEGAECNEASLTGEVCNAFVNMARCLSFNDCDYLENKDMRVDPSKCTVKQFEDRCLPIAIHRYKRQDEPAADAAGDETTAAATQPPPPPPPPSTARPSGAETNVAGWGLLLFLWQAAVLLLHLM